MNKKAFTLIELLAVVVIIAIIATIGIFSVTKIMSKARLNTLKDTAYGVRKAGQLYATSNEIIAPLTLDMTPGTGAQKNLIELSKDPWGKNYALVEAKINIVNGQTIINVYITTEKGCYELLNGEDTLGESDVCAPCFGLSSDGSTLLKWRPQVSGCANEIAIPEGVELIGEYAFRTNTGIEYRPTSLTMPSSLRYIGRSAFSDLRLDNAQIVIPEGVKYVGEWAFSSNSLDEITLPSTLKYIGYSAFAGNNFSSLNLPVGVEHIERDAFERYDTPVMAALTLPGANAYIDPTAFNGWLDPNTGDPLVVRSNITYSDPGDCFNTSAYGVVVSKVNACTTLVIPQTVNGITIKAIQNDVFAASNITSVVLPNTLEYIGRASFRSNPIQNLTLPTNLKMIRSYGLENTALTDIQFPSALLLIGEGAFQGVDGLTDIIVPSTVKYVGCWNPFNQCQNN